MTAPSGALVHLYNYTCQLGFRLFSYILKKMMNARFTATFDRNAHQDQRISCYSMLPWQREGTSWHRALSRTSKQGRGECLHTTTTHNHSWCGSPSGTPYKISKHLRVSVQLRKSTPLPQLTFSLYLSLAYAVPHTSPHKHGDEGWYLSSLFLLRSPADEHTPPLAQHLQ